ncbi:cyclin dependent kinase [Volvox carteri f. nagariensis]|uniref:Cyclin dependent kinase n=1 Tax=Volvox carteri f. nagariensis TaxID=3068 RepID=D8UFR6_VOLCA|nr:cyclin dependent kinase [Volvox carteri f. nagariensis]EFJ41427.1 cyclin dependent kinase [Volvox carteri f. nagariensis]|eukprot:XP_002957533.1 cyclin dependent kinase [Volvox carteri f. nagariensis]
MPVCHPHTINLRLVNTIFVNPPGRIPPQRNNPPNPFCHLPFQIPRLVHPPLAGRASEQPPISPAGSPTPLLPGEGTYGLVYHARSKETGGRYAIKQFKSGREGDGVSPTAIREIMLLREMSHPNIVKLESAHINHSEPSLWLAFEYAEYDLYEMIKFHRDNKDNRRDNPFGLMPQYIVKTVMWHLLNGLSYMHQHWVVHRDLKPSNVLVMGEDPAVAPSQHGCVKIADFGLARIFQAPARPLSDNGVVVTIWYRAPELLLGARHYTRAVDVWAAGCIFAELLTLKPLFQGQERKTPGNVLQADQLDKIFRVLGHPGIKTWPELEVLPHWVDNTDNVRVRRPEWGGTGLHSAILEAMRAIDLMSRMLDYNPSSRATAEEALRHEWFRTEPKPGPNVFRMQVGSWNGNGHGPGGSCWA